MLHTTKLATLRGKRMRISKATNGSRIKAMITAVIDVMKKTRPKYKTAITTPMATTGIARCRASCTALAAVLTGWVTSATKQ